MLVYRDIDLPLNERLDLIRFPLPVPVVRVVRVASLQRPTPETMDWAITLAPGMRFSRELLRLPGGSVLVDPDPFIDED